MSKLTEKLKLFIWQIPEDIKEKFNYLKAIAENFEKIDENAQSVDTRIETLETENTTNNEEISNIKEEQITQNGEISNIKEEQIIQNEEILNIKEEQIMQNGEISNIKEEQITQNGEISNIKEEQITQKEEIKRAQNKSNYIENILPTGQAQGQNTTLTDSVRYPFKELKIIGNTIQEESEEGNNKFCIEGAFKYGDGTDRTTVNNDGTITTTSNFAESRNKGTLIQGLKQNTTYTVSLDGVSIEASSGPTHAEIEILKANAQIIKQETFWGANNTVIGKRVKVPFNTGDNTEVSIHISGFYTAGQTGQFVYKNVMLVEGTDIEYEPYVKDTPSPKYPSEIKNCNSINIKISNAKEQQNLEFPLSQGQVLRKGDYLADDGIHHVRKQLILQGTENWEYDNNCVKMLKSDIKGVNETIISDIKSSHFKVYTQANVQEGVIKNGIAVREEGNNGIIIRKEGIESGEQFNTWLQQENDKGSPVIIEYESKEEMIENYTEEQQTAYEKLKKLYSYEGTTTIECIDEISCEFKVIYIKNLQEYIKQQMQEIISTEEVAMEKVVVEEEE